MVFLMPMQANNAFDPSVFLANVSSAPGVYVMKDDMGTVLYVGKAKNLRKRLASYFGSGGATSIKTKKLVSQIANIETLITLSEHEALLLENNLIKHHQPKYNVLLRDDKSYPSIILSIQHDFPALFISRKRQPGWKCFGPYTSMDSAKHTLELCYRFFNIRSCQDRDFAHRGKPCLEYQLKRCAAPCVGYISKEAYQAQLTLVQDFLEGRNETLIQKLIAAMEAASAQCAFEEAARHRDLIAHVRRIQNQQVVFGSDGHADVWAMAKVGSHTGAAVLHVRDGSIQDSQVFFSTSIDEENSAIMAQILLQYYDEMSQWPALILCADLDDEIGGTQSALCVRAWKGELSARYRLDPKLGEDWLKMAKLAATAELEKRLTREKIHERRFKRLTEILKQSIERVECFDVSHSKGQHSYVSCVVMDGHGLVRSGYRAYSIEDANGDDYLALREILTKRYSKHEPPSVIIVDGGKGQLGVLKTVAQAHFQTQAPLLMAISKGADRKKGQETIYLVWEQEIQELVLPHYDDAFHLLQLIRDEAHRFALKHHRRSRRKAELSIPVLQHIPGLGAKRQQRLLHHFGGLEALKQAHLEDIARVPQIGKDLAQKIYQSVRGILSG